METGVLMTARRLKTLSLVAGVIIAGLTLMSWTQTWFVVVLGGQAAGHPPIAADGSVSAPAVSALAIACLAALGAMAISGRFFRAVLAVLQIVIGACIVLSAFLALSGSATAVASLVTDATSITGADSVAALIDSITATAWPWLALISGALLIVLGGIILGTGRRWPDSSRRYQPVRFENADGSDSPRSDVVESDSLEPDVLEPDSPGSGSPESDWDSLSGGSDPTSR